jgi:hypothetical protein
MAILKKTTTVIKTNPITGTMKEKKKFIDTSMKGSGDPVSIKIKEKTSPKNFSENSTTTQTRKKNIFGTNVIKNVTKNEAGKVMSITKAKYKK